MRPTRTHSGGRVFPVSGARSSISRRETMQEAEKETRNS